MVNHPDWLVREAPLAMLPHLLDAVARIYTADSATRQEMGQRLRDTLRNLETSVERFSSQRSSEAKQLASGSDRRATLIRTWQDLALPSQAEAGHPLRTGIVPFHGRFIGMVRIAHSFVQTQIPGGDRVPLEELTDPTRYQSLVVAFCALMSALDTQIDLGHPHTYKTTLDHASQPGRLQRAMHDMAAQVQLHLNATAGSGPGVLRLGGGRYAFV
jgi:hypothetical protein